MKLCREQETELTQLCPAPHAGIFFRARRYSGTKKRPAERSRPLGSPFGRLVHLKREVAIPTAPGQRKFLVTVRQLVACLGQRDARLLAQVQGRVREETVACTAET